MWDRPYHFHTPHPKQYRSKRNAKQQLKRTTYAVKVCFSNVWKTLKCPNDCVLSSFVVCKVEWRICRLIYSACAESWSRFVFQNAEQCPWARDRKYTPDDFCSNRWPGYENFLHVFLSSSFANKCVGFPSFISHAAPLGYQATSMYLGCVAAYVVLNTLLISFRTITGVEIRFGRPVFTSN